MGTLSRGDLPISAKIDRASIQSRILNKQGKVPTSPATRTGMAGNSVVHSIRTLGDSSTETDGINECHKKILHKLDLLPQKLGETHRISELRNTNFDPISSSLATAPSTSTSRFDFYKRPTTPSTRPIEESSHPLDEPLNTKAKRNLLRRSQSCPPMDRCIPNRMGRTHKFFLCNRILESNRDETAHKHSRDKSSLPQISTSQSGEQDNPFIHGQCTSVMQNKQAFMQISESPKRDSNPYSNSPDEKLKNQSISQLDSTQLESRRSQSHSSSPNRMGATYENIQRNNTLPRTSADRPNGVKQQLQSRDLHIPLPRPNSNRTQCASMGFIICGTRSTFSLRNG